MRWPFTTRRSDAARPAAKTLVLVDGRNVQRSTWPNPGEKSLLAALDRWAAAEAELRDVVVVFDGALQGDSTWPHLDVHAVPYADDELVSLARASRRSGRAVLAATSDRELRDRLEALGVDVAWGGGRLLHELGLAQRGRRR